MSADQEWWRGAVIYQIYPRSYYDTNRDGVGDLPGITQKLTHIASLGVDAIWISPFFKSPMKDFGYDIEDYCDVDPLFGTVEDAKRLVIEAHRLGLKVMIDQVLSHTSDQHAWFQASRQDRSNDKADWYVWSNPKPDGSPPNNWLSIFGGCAWQWDTSRKQYYLHNFLTEQPDLNLHQADVQAALLKSMRFWLELGVDGFRLDVINFCMHDQRLRDNPALQAGEPRFVGVSEDNPYAYQYHRYDMNQPENLDFLRRVRALLDEYPATASVGEIGANDPLQIMADYTSGNDKLHMAYTFNLLGEQSSTSYIKDVIAMVESRIGDGWPCWSLSNHDVVRCVSRWGEASPDPAAFAKVMLALLLSLRGSACLYQGEELGLPEANVPFEKLQDPYGITFWPEFKGRDGCRTPFPWQAQQPHAGFSEAEPWLPVDVAHRSLACDQQEADAGSVLNHYRQFIKWRKAQVALLKGKLQLLATEAENVLYFIREHQGQRLLVALNLGADACRFACAYQNVRVLSGHGFNADWQDQHIVLNGYDAFFAELL